MTIPNRPLSMWDVGVELDTPPPTGLRDPDVMSLIAPTPTDPLAILDLEGASSLPPPIYDGFIDIGITYLYNDPWFVGAINTGSNGGKTVPELMPDGRRIVEFSQHRGGGSVGDPRGDIIFSMAGEYSIEFTQIEIIDLTGKIVSTLLRKDLTETIGYGGASYVNTFAANPINLFGGRSSGRVRLVIS